MIFKDFNKGKRKIHIIDFEDSFTYNIASTCYEMFKAKAEIILWKDTKRLSEIVNAKNGIIIWGPGPGHPSEYGVVFPYLKKSLQEPTIFNYGICLGHQLIWSLKGADVVASERPLHGEAVEITIPDWSFFPKNEIGKKVFVQRYNSLMVSIKGVGIDQTSRAMIVTNELFMSFGMNFFSCQFHPESIGTSCPKTFFSGLILYNGNDGC